MVKDHSDSEKGNPLPPHRLLLSINSKGFYMHHPTDRITHTTAFVTPVVAHWLEREIAQWAEITKQNKRHEDKLKCFHMFLDLMFLDLLRNKCVHF